MVGSDANGFGSGSTTAFDIAVAITHHPTVGKIHAMMPSRL